MAGTDATNDRTAPAQSIADARNALIEELSKGNRKYVRFVLAALGSIPWVGSVLSALATLDAEREQGKINELQELWLEEHKAKIENLGKTIHEVLTRLEGFGDEVQARLESPQYLALVRKTFRSWDQADTEEKRKMLQKLLTNAGAIELCPDDLIRLFIAWIDRYHEAHFLVIKEIYQNPGITRGALWDRIHNQRPRDNSAEADLYRYLIRELSQGAVIRQPRETDSQGRFRKKGRSKRTRRGSGPQVLESAFEETKPYVLTELGNQFVHYVMEDVAPQIGEQNE